MKICSICSSAYRSDYEKFYDQGNRIGEVYYLSTRQPYNDSIAKSSFYNHFHYHYGNSREGRAIDLKQKLRSKILKQELNNSVTIIKQLNHNLTICNKKIKELLSSSNYKDSVLLQYMSEVRQTTSEIRMTLKDFKLQTVENDGNIFEKIMFCMDDFSIEDIQKFKAKWDQHENNN